MEPLKKKVFTRYSGWWITDKCHKYYNLPVGKYPKVHQFTLTDIYQDMILLKKYSK